MDVRYVTYGHMPNHVIYPTNPATPAPGILKAQITSVQVSSAIRLRVIGYWFSATTIS